MSTSAPADGAAGPVVASPLVVGASSSSGDRSSGAPSAPREDDVVLPHPTPPPPPAFQKTRSRFTTVSVELMSPTEGPPGPLLPSGCIDPDDRCPLRRASGRRARLCRFPSDWSGTCIQWADHPVVPPSSPAVPEGELVSATRWLGVPSLDAPLLSVDEL